MPYEHGRRNGIIEKYAYGRNRNFFRRSVDQNSNRTCPKDLQLLELTPSGPRLPLFTVIFVDTDAFSKVSTSLLPDIAEGKNFESESSKMNHHEPPSPQLFMVGLRATNTDFTSLSSSCISSEASSSDQSTNKLSSPLVSPSTPLPLCSTSGNSSGSVCDSASAVGTDFLVNDFSKVEKRVKRNPRKKGKKKGKQYKRIASRKVSTEPNVQSNGNTYSPSAFEASTPTSHSSSGKHLLDNNMSDEAAHPSLLDIDISLDKDHCSNNIEFVDSPNLFLSTSYSDETEDFEQLPSSQRFAGDELGCNTTASLHSSCTIEDAEAVPSTFDGSSRQDRFKENGTHDGNFSSISVDKSLDCWNSDIGENSSDDIVTRLLVKDESGPSSSECEIIPPSEEVTQYDTSSRTITMNVCNSDVEVSKGYNDDSYLSNDVIDACSSTERADCSSQAGSSNDFHPVISGRRGRRNRRMIDNGGSNGANRYSTASIHSNTGKDNSYSIWQKVQKCEKKESVSKPNNISVMSPQREVSSKDTKMKTKHNKSVGVKQKQSGMTCRYPCSDAISKVEPSQVASRGPKVGRNHSKPTVGNSVSGIKSKSSSGVKHANQYQRSGSYTGKTDMPNSQQKEDMQNSLLININNHSDLGLKSPCNSLSQISLCKMTDNIECCPPESEKVINVLMDEATPSGNACNGVCHASLPAAYSEISHLPTSLGQSDQRQVEANSENGSTKYSKDIQGLSVLRGEDQQLTKPDTDNHRESNSLTTVKTPVQKWVPVGRKDVAVSVNNEAAVSQLHSGVAELEDSSSKYVSSTGKDGEVSCHETNKMTSKLMPYHHSAEVLDLCTVTNCKTYEVKEKEFIGFDTDLDKIIGAVNVGCKLRTRIEGAQMVSGCPVADYEKFLSSASPVIRQTQRSTTCNSCSPEQLIGNSLCLHQIPNISLKHIWQWYEEPGCFGLEVKAHDFSNSRRLQNGHFGFTAYFVPYLSAVQLFRISRHNRCCNLGGQPAMTGVSSSQEDLSNIKNHLGNEELIFEYFEYDQPPRRRPLYDKIKELVNSDKLTDGCVFGDPLQLENVELHDLHPASWYCVAWYPIYRIPDGNFHAAFLTYHSLGHFVRQSAPGTVPGAFKTLVSPVVGLQTYNDKGENWFQPRDSNSKAIHSEDASYSNTSQLIKERLRTLKQTASVMARAVISKENQKSMNRHPDYEFFVSRSW
ncbi:hypothetical protein Cni_G03530 [Canna indica]|uniref:Uncharacterized protein n=1 Tax=Canna indica TaxID=4628 RepID=A0AAQ3Q355_9LILI|nr:hypothetical protein Cni_G03530 [Canna indica]